MIRSARELAEAWCGVDHGSVAVAVVATAVIVVVLVVHVGVEPAWAASLLLGPATTIHPWETAELHHCVVAGQSNALSNLLP